MIITRDTAQGYWQLLFAEKDVVKVEVEPDDLTVWFEYSDEPWSIREFKRDSSMERWLQTCWDTMPVVCVEHKRFIPCRVEDGCKWSIEPEDVVMVRRWHEEARGGRSSV